MCKANKRALNCVYISKDNTAIKILKEKQIGQKNKRD